MLLNVYIFVKGETKMSIIGMLLKILIAIIIVGAIAAVVIGAVIAIVLLIKKQNNKKQY